MGLISTNPKCVKGWAEQAVNPLAYYNQFTCLYKNITQSYQQPPTGQTYFNPLDSLVEVLNGTSRLTQITVCTYSNTNTSTFALSLSMQITSYTLSNDTSQVQTSRPLIFDYKSHLTNNCSVVKIDPLKEQSLTIASLLFLNGYLQGVQFTISDPTD